MKKIITILLVLIVVSCKKNAKKASETEIKKELIILNCGCQLFIYLNNEKKCFYTYCLFYS